MQKKQNIIRAAIRLFATQGFDGTTTLQIAHEAQVTEPLIYYHFKGKDDLFTHILKAAFKEYFEMLDGLTRETETQFEKIDQLIRLHFKIIAERPDETFLIINTCPAKLNDTDLVCSENLEKQRKALLNFLAETVAAGVQSGEFHDVPVEDTAMLLVAMISGLVRRRMLKYEDVDAVCRATIDFIHRSLVK
jgi:AcrR family transcriptional regulator